MKYVFKENNQQDTEEIDEVYLSTKLLIFSLGFMTICLR